MIEKSCSNCGHERVCAHLVIKKGLKAWSSSVIASHCGDFDPFGWRFDEPPKDGTSILTIEDGGLPFKVKWKQDTFYSASHDCYSRYGKVLAKWQYIPSAADLERLKGLE